MPVLISPSGNPVFTPKKFEYTKSCDNKYLMEGKDFLIFEFEATGSNSSYPFNQGLFGPQFYYTTTIYNNPVNVSFNWVEFNISVNVYSLDPLLPTLCAFSSSYFTLIALSSPVE